MVANGSMWNKAVDMHLLDAYDEGIANAERFYFNRFAF